VCDIDEKDISCPPPQKKLKKSQCTPLFMNAYTMRGMCPLHTQCFVSVLDCIWNALSFSFTGAQAVIHTHSKSAVMATLMFPGKEFCITHQEMIKGIRKGNSNTNYRLYILLH